MSVDKKNILIEERIVMTNKKRVQISLTKEQYLNLENISKEKGFSKSAILALALEEYSRKE